MPVGGGGIAASAKSIPLLPEAVLAAPAKGSLKTTRRLEHHRRRPRGPKRSLSRLAATSFCAKARHTRRSDDLANRMNASLTACRLARSLSHSQPKLIKSPIAAGETTICITMAPRRRRSRRRRCLSATGEIWRGEGASTPLRVTRDASVQVGVVGYGSVDLRRSPQSAPAGVRVRIVRRARRTSLRAPATRRPAPAAPLMSSS